MLVKLGVAMAVLAGMLVGAGPASAGGREPVPADEAGLGDVVVDADGNRFVTSSVAGVSGPGVTFVDAVEWRLASSGPRRIEPVTIIKRIDAAPSRDGLTYLKYELRDLTPTVDADGDRAVGFTLVIERSRDGDVVTETTSGTAPTIAAVFETDAVRAAAGSLVDDGYPAAFATATPREHILLGRQVGLRTLVASAVGGGGAVTPADALLVVNRLRRSV